MQKIIWGKKKSDISDKNCGFDLVSVLLRFFVGHNFVTPYQYDNKIKIILINLIITIITIAK